LARWSFGIRRHADFRVLPLSEPTAKSHPMIAPFSRVFVSVVFFASVALADDFKTIDGKEYKNAKVSRVEPDGIVLMTNSGVSKIYFTELPKEVQERFHYDAQKAAEFTSQTIEKNKLFVQQRAEEEKKRVEERAKDWAEQENK